MFRVACVLAALSLAMLGGCKKDESDSGAPSEPAIDAPTVDCAQFAKRLEECVEPFVQEYAKTNSGERLRGDTPEAKAKNLGTGLRMHVSSGAYTDLCDGKESMFLGDDFNQRDPAWRIRFAACDATAPCEQWATCYANAVGSRL